MKDAIERRISVRSYEKRPLSYEDGDKVRVVLDTVQQKKGPFGHQATFFSRLNKSEDGKNVGTYGFIKHPPLFIGGVIKNSFEGMVDFGFLFEEVLLRLTKEALGTVWLGGTFDRDAFHVKMGFNQVIPAISPVGYPAKQPMRETLTHGVTGERRRQPFDALFFMGETLSGVPEDHPYHQYLEAVRAAPSASNKQPWRIVVIGDTFHLYLKRTVNYGKNMPMDIQALDAGIALSHLYLTLETDGYPSEFKQEKPMDLDDAEYVLSVTVEKDNA